MNLRIVSLNEALASKRRFRYMGALDPAGHTMKTGHVWRVPGLLLTGEAARLSEQNDFLPQTLRCIECSVQVAVWKGNEDLWLIEKSEYELTEISLEIIQNLGIRFDPSIHV